MFLFQLIQLVIFSKFLFHQSDPKGINAAILKAFEKFGKVESVENVKGSASKSKPDVHEAYITFARSEDAYRAFIENRNEIKSSEEIITVLPIDTWKILPVPKKHDEINELDRRISDVDYKADSNFIIRLSLTPHSLLRVFRSFVRSTKPFLDGLDLEYELENESDCESDDETVRIESSDEESSNEVKKTEKPPKQTNETNDEKSQEATDEEESKVEEINCIQNHEFEKRIAEIVVKNLGLNFEILTLRKDAITREMLQWFAPALKQLTKLSIYTVSNCRILYALHEYCPNVENLHLEGCEWEGEFDQIPIEAWPSLKEFYLDVDGLCDDENGNEGNKKFQRFIELNPQLTDIQIDTVIDLGILSTIGRTLIDLTTLAFVRDSFEGLNAVLDNVNGLKKMCGLKMSVLEVEKNDLNGLLKCAKRLSRLPQLQLITIFLNCEPNTEEPEDFFHLSDFCITHHNDCACHGPNRILSFRNHDVEVPEESAVLALIINTKPPQFSADKTLEADIFSALKKTTKFFPNIIKNVELEGKNHHIYVQISSDKI